MKFLLAYLLSALLVFNPAYAQVIEGTQAPGLDAESNFIQNGSFDLNAKGVMTYADAAQARPVDGTGGTANVTTGLETSAPINGKKSLVLIKDGVNRQGQGWSIDFTIPEKYKAKVLKIEGASKVLSGSFTAGFGGTSPTDSDVIVYIYDKTNNAVIEPNNFRILSNSSSLVELFENMEFQASLSTQYRLILHIATSNASPWSLVVDDLKVVPVRKGSGSSGSSGWRDFPSVAAGTLITASTTNPSYGTVVTNKAQYSYDNDGWMNLKWDFRQSNSTGAVAGSGVYLLNIPPSICVIDTNKVKANSTTGGTFLSEYGDGSVGTFVVNDAAGTGIGSASVFSSSQIRFQYQYAAGASSSAGGWSSSYGQLTLVQSVSVNAKVPCVGRDSSVTRSSEDDMRVVSFVGYSNSVQALTANTTNINLTSLKDSHGALSGSAFTVLIPGDYSISSTLVFSAATGVRVYLNGIPSQYLSYGGTGTLQGGSTIIPNLKSGDVLSFRTDGSVSTVPGTQYNISIQRIAGPQSIAAVENISASYWMSANTTLTAANPVNFDSREYDSHGLVTTGAGVWKFTAQAAGEYEISGFANQSTGTASSMFMLWKNGAVAKSLCYSYAGSPTTFKARIRLNQGDYIDVRPVSTIPIAGGALNGGGYTSYIQISRVGL